MIITSIILFWIFKPVWILFRYFSIRGIRTPEYFSKGLCCKFLFFIAKKCQVQLLPFRYYSNNSTKKFWKPFPFGLWIYADKEICPITVYPWNCKLSFLQISIYQLRNKNTNMHFNTYNNESKKITVQNDISNTT